MEDFLNIGKIVNTHGIKGEVKVLPLTDDPERFALLKKVNVKLNGKINIFTITSIKHIKQTVILKFNEINEMNEAEKLKGAMLVIDKKDAIILPEDSFFIDDIIDCEVFDNELGSLGKVNEILETGSNDVYIVKGSSKYKEVLIPALKTVIRKVDIANKRIDVILPEGLLDD